MQPQTDTPTCALLLIGNELLSGRTRDANLQALATRLAPKGLRLSEVRIIPDVPQVIESQTRALSDAYDYVFTSGGIGPTHDDITAECIARAFGVELLMHPQAVALLEGLYGKEELTEARLRMARIPSGGSLIANPVSAAPGFRIENVHVLAGVPRIFAAMVDSLLPSLKGGKPLVAFSVYANLAESKLADTLADLEALYAGVSLGSYPSMREGRFGLSVVARGEDEAQVRTAIEAVAEAMRKLGAEPEGIETSL